MTTYIQFYTLILLIILSNSTDLWGQEKPTFQWNALVDIELSKAGEASHYYFNEIDKEHTDVRLDFSQVNLMGKVIFNPRWLISGRLLLERNRGRKLNKFLIPQLNVQWLSKNRRLGLTAGSFTNPFGSFNTQQLSTDRNFVGLPLAYSYYVNVSDKFGFVEGLGDLDDLTASIGEEHWGSTNLYYGGYTTGAMLSWNIKPAKLHWKIALTTGASNQTQPITTPINVGLTSRLKVQAAYFWQQGFSVSHGTFLRESKWSQVGEYGAQINRFRQSLIGTDFKLGHGFFEISGEIIGAFYQVPVFIPDDKTFHPATLAKPISLSNVSAYLDIKYEFPFLPGSYMACRIDGLGFGKLNGDSYNVTKWDNDMLRYSLAVGYDITRNILVRVAVSSQQAKNKNWNKTQRTFRLVLTGHY